MTITINHSSDTPSTTEQLTSSPGMVYVKGIPNTKNARVTIEASPDTTAENFKPLRLGADALQAQRFGRTIAEDGIFACAPIPADWHYRIIPADCDGATITVIIG